MSQRRSNNANWAYKVIVFVATALRPLCVVYVALTLWDGQVGHINNSLDQDSEDNFKKDLRHCGSMLRIQNMRLDASLMPIDVMTLVHQTTKDFLTRNRDLAGSFHVGSDMAHV